MLKPLAALTALTISLSASAGEAVVAKMKFHTTNGDKAFSAQWFEGSNLGIVQFILVWDQYNQDVKDGFKLESAKAKTFVSPALPEGCKIVSLKGTLNWLEHGTSAVGMTVSGKPCETFINALEKTPMVVQFSEVEHQTNTGAVDSLTLQIVELP